MSQANVDLVRSIYAAWERGDFSSVAWAPEIEFEVADGPSPTTLTGVAEVTDWKDDFLSAWEAYRLKADDYRELDDERVLVLMHAGGGRGKASGLELGQHGGGGAQIFHIRDGKVTRVVIYFNRERAFADLGLAPKADAADSP